MIAVRTLREFWEYHPDARAPLEDWYDLVESLRWEHAAEAVATVPGVSVLSDRRLVFNIGGNKYRLVAKCGSLGPTRTMIKSTPTRSDAMDIRPIRTEQDYEAALARIDSLMEHDGDPDARDEIEVLVVLVKAWEAKHHPIGTREKAPASEPPRRE